MHNATCHLFEPGRHNKYLPQAADYVCYWHMRTATTASRGHITPFEALKGSKPNITHARCFGTICFPIVAKEERHERVATKLLQQPGVRGMFLGYQNMWSTTFKVLLDERQGTLTHTRHASFDLDAPGYSALPDQGPYRYLKS